MGRLSGKNAMVTGATSGIGEAIARRLSAEGATVAVVGRRRDKGEQVARSIQEKGGKAFYVHADVSDSKSVESMVNACVEKFDEGTISVLVNDAGVSTGNAPMEYVTEEDWDKVMDTNAKGTFLVSRAVIPLMVKAGGGSVINVSSAGGLRGYVGGTAYASSKAAVIMLTKVLALEQGKNKIRANCVCPGSVHSEMFDGGINNFAKKVAGKAGAPTGKQIVENIANAIPLGRIGEPEDVANLVSFLSSEEATYINGAILVLDGGQSL